MKTSYAYFKSAIFEPCIWLQLQTLPSSFSRNLDVFQRHPKVSKRLQLSVATAASIDQFESQLTIIRCTVIEIKVGFHLEILEQFFFQSADGSYHSLLYFADCVRKRAPILKSRTAYLPSNPAVMRKLTFFFSSDGKLSVLC